MSETSEVLTSTPLEIEPLPANDFQQAVGEIALDLAYRASTALRPETKQHEENTAADPSLRYRLVPARESRGRAWVSTKALEKLGQTEVLTQAQRHAQSIATGTPISDDEFRHTASELAVPPDSNQFRKAIGHLQGGLSGALTTQHDPEFVRDAQVRNSKESLEMAEVNGRVKGYTMVLEQLRQFGAINTAHERASNIVVNNILPKPSIPR